MKRETENTILLLVGLSVGLIVGTGVFTRYVKPSLLPWLVLTAALLIGLALTLCRNVGRGDDDHGSVRALNDCERNAAQQQRHPGQSA